MPPVRTHQLNSGVRDGKTMKAYFLQTLLFFGATFLQSCQENQPIKARTFGFMKSKFEILVSIPWGQGDQKIAPKFLEHPNFSLVSPKQMRHVYAPLRIKVDAQKGIHVLNDDYRHVFDGDDIYIMHFTAEGIFAGKTPVAKNYSGAKNRRIKDFVVDQALNCYLLEDYSIEDNAYNRLLKLDKNGKILWSLSSDLSQTTGNIDRLEGRFNKLLMDGQSHLYITSADRVNTLTQISLESGKVIKLYTLEHGSDNIFMNSGGIILSVVYFEEQNRRGFAAFNPLSGKENFTVGNTELFGLLLFPFGVDARLNCYTYKVPNVYKMPALVKIALDGQITHQESLKDLLARSGDDAIFISYPQNDTLTIHGYYRDGTNQVWAIRLPDRYVSDQSANQKLIKVDERNRFYILLGEQPETIGSVLIFSESGQLEQEIPSPADLLSLESSLQPYSFWQVDGEGNIYFPVTDPEGFKVVRMSLAK